MRASNAHLLADVDLHRIEVALSNWNWLLGNTRRPILVSAVGDVFMEAADGSVARLDTGAGSIEAIAESAASFETVLSDPTRSNELLLSSIVAELWSAGMRLGPNQCYGMKTLPIFAEGSYRAENRFIIDAAEFIALAGDLHSQIAALPDGAKVTISDVS